MLPLPLLALLLTAAPASAATTERDCATAGRPIDGNAQVRVYRRGETVFACSLENGRRIVLGVEYFKSTTGTADVRLLALAGRLVAWVHESCLPDYQPLVCSTRLTIATPATRRARFRRHFESSTVRVTDLVLRLDGAGAWVEDDPRGTRSLHVRDKSGESVAVTSADIADLALSELSTVYWTEAGIPQLLRLPRTTSLADPRADEDRPRCGRPGLTTLANPWVRVYTDPEEDVYDACSTETGRIYRQGAFSETEDVEERQVGPIALAGRFVASARTHVVHVDFDTSRVSRRVTLTDVRRGRRRTIAKPEGEVAGPILLKRNGSAAWNEFPLSVRFVDGAGNRFVGLGDDIALSRSSLVYWTDLDDVPRAAALR